MNEQYINSGNGYVVMDENGLRKANYNSNIQEVLVTENLLKQIDIDIPTIEEEISEKQEEIVSVGKFIKVPFIGGCIVGVIMLLLSIILSNVMGATAGNLGETVLLTAMFPTVSFIIGLGFTFDNLFKHSYLLNDKKGLESGLEFLNSEKKKLEEKLDSLNRVENQQEKDLSINGNQDEVQKVMYIEALKELKDNLKLYNIIGTNKDEYVTLYKEGTLREKLKSYYTAEFIDLIESKISEIVNSEDKPKVIEKK